VLAAVVSTSETSSMVTLPFICRPMPTDSVVTPAGTTGVVHDACCQVEVAGSRGDCAHHWKLDDDVRENAKIAGCAVDLYQALTL
jgi:hypothetical protein